MPLLISRRPNESIYIGGGIKLTVVDVIGSKAKILIDAPKGVCIVREEIAREQEWLKWLEKPMTEAERVAVEVQKL